MKILGFLIVSCQQKCRENDSSHTVGVKMNSTTFFENGLIYKNCKCLNPKSNKCTSKMRLGLERKRKGRRHTIQNEQNVQQ